MLTIPPQCCLRISRQQYSKISSWCRIPPLRNLHGMHDPSQFH